MIKARYALLMRPPAPGAIPRDGLLEVGDDCEKAPSGHRAWGWAEYNRVLSEKEKEEYDLECIWIRKLSDAKIS